MILGNSRPVLGLSFSHPLLPGHVSRLSWLTMLLTATCSYSVEVETAASRGVILGSSRPEPGLNCLLLALLSLVPVLRWLMTRLMAMFFSSEEVGIMV